MAKNKSIKDILNAGHNPTSDAPISNPINPGNTGARKSTEQGLDSLMNAHSRKQSSPALNVKHISSTERLVELPVSKKKTVFKLVEISPKDTTISKLNPRDQSMLTMNNPVIQEITHSIANDGQTDPIWCRETNKSGKYKYEVFIGSTRRFAANHIVDTINSEFKLLAWVGEASDDDVARLSRMENHYRRELSFYEKAYDAVHSTNTEALKNKSYDQKAVLLGISKSTFSHYTNALQLIPLKFVALLENPNELTMRASIRLISKLKLLDSPEQLQSFINVNKSASFSDIKYLESAFNEWFDINVLTNKEGSNQAVTTLHSKSGSGQITIKDNKKNGSLKINVDKLTDEKAVKLKAFLKDLLD